MNRDLTLWACVVNGMGQRHVIEVQSDNNALVCYGCNTVFTAEQVAMMQRVYHQHGDDLEEQMRHLHLQTRAQRRCGMLRVAPGV